MKTFRDWVAVRESSAFTRTRGHAADGTGVTIPSASINSRSTALPSVSRAIQKRNKCGLLPVDGDEG